MTTYQRFQKHDYAPGLSDEERHQLAQKKRAVDDHAAAILRQANGIHGGYEEPLKPEDEKCRKCNRPKAIVAELDPTICKWCEDGTPRGK